MKTAVVKSAMAPPAQAEAMQRFIDTEDMSRLEKPLIFDRNDRQFKKFMCCQGCLVTTCTYGMNLCFVPIGACCPYMYAKEFSLRLDKDAVTLRSAGNDCCCHIATSLKTVPLEKIQDVELQTNCLLSCFGLKAVNVQTAGQGGSMVPEVSAKFLKEPEKVRDAIRLAVKLRNQGPAQNGNGGARPAWGEVTPLSAGPKGAGLAQRLQGLEGLVTRGVLGKPEADTLKISVLAAPTDTWLARLSETADLYDKRLITAEEFSQIKASLLAQIRAAANH